MYIIFGFLPLGANLILIPFITNALLPEEYALVGLSVIIQTYLSFFISLSLDSSFTRYYYEVESTARRRNILGTCIMLFAIMAMAVAILVILFFPLYKLIFHTQFHENLLSVFLYSLLNAWAVVVVSFITTYFRLEENVKKFVLISTISFFIPAFAVIFSINYFGGSASSVIISRALSAAVISVLIIVFFFGTKKLSFEKTLLKKMLVFSLPLMGYQLFFAVFSTIDRMFVLSNTTFETSEAGVYNFAVLISTIFLVFTSSWYNAVSPVIYTSIKKENFNLAVQLQNFSLIITNLGLFLCVLFVCPAVFLIISTSYHSCLTYIGLLFMAFVPYTNYLIYQIPVFFEKKTYVFLLNSIAALLAALSVCVLGIEKFGMYAVIASVITAKIVQLLVNHYFFYKQKLNKLPYMQGVWPLWRILAIFMFYLFVYWMVKPITLGAIMLVNAVPLLLLLVYMVFYYHSFFHDLKFLFTNKVIVNEADRES